MKVQQSAALKLLRHKLNTIARLSPTKAGDEMFKLFCTPFEKSNGSDLGYFAHQEKLQMTTNGFKLFGYRANRGGSKRVLILHGFTSSFRNFQHFVEPLVTKGYEVIAFDAPAHGESDGEQINALLYSEMIVDVCNQFGPIDGFISHSLGGLALALALEKMDHSPETKVVFIAPATETKTAITQAYAMMQLQNETRLKDLLYDAILRVSGKEAGWYSVNRAMQNIKANILWVHDEDDLITPLSDTEPTRNANLSNLKFVITKGLGHQKIYRDPEVVNLATDFL